MAPRNRGAGPGRRRGPRPSGARRPRPARGAPGARSRPWPGCARSDSARGPGRPSAMIWPWPADDSTSPGDPEADALLSRTTRWPCSSAWSSTSRSRWSGPSGARPSCAARSGRALDAGPDRRHGPRAPGRASSPGRRSTATRARWPAGSRRCAGWSSRSTGATPSRIWTRRCRTPRTCWRGSRPCPGFGEQKARIFVALLGKQLGVDPEGLAGGLRPLRRAGLDPLGGRHRRRRQPGPRPGLQTGDEGGQQGGGTDKQAGGPNKKAAADQGHRGPVRRRRPGGAKRPPRPARRPRPSGRRPPDAAGRPDDQGRRPAG